MFTSCDNNSYKVKCHQRQEWQHSKECLCCLQNIVMCGYHESVTTDTRTDRQCTKPSFAGDTKFCWMPDIWPWCFNLKSFIIKPYTCSIFPISRQRPLSKTMIWKWFQKQETHNTYVWPHPSLSCWPCAREDLSLFWQGWQRTVNYWPCATCGKKDCV